MERLRASFSRGNHHNGSDYVLRDSSNFGLKLIKYLIHGWEMCDFESSTLQLKREEIKVNYGPRDAFGQEIKVSAPSEIWELAKTDYQFLLQHLVEERGFAKDEAEHFISKLR